MFLLESLNSLGNHLWPRLDSRLRLPPEPRGSRTESAIKRGLSNWTLEALADLPVADRLVEQTEDHTVQEGLFKKKRLNLFCHPCYTPMVALGCFGWFVFHGEDL